MIPWSFRRLLDSIEDEVEDENSLRGITPRGDDSLFAFLLSSSEASIVPHSSSSDGSGSSSSSFSTSLENPVLLEKEAEGELPSVSKAGVKPEVDVEALLRAQALLLRSQLYREHVISTIKKNKDNDKVHAFNYFRLVTFCFLLLLSHIWWIVDVVLWSFDFYSTGVNGVWFGNPLEQCPLKTW